MRCKAFEVNASAYLMKADTQRRPGQAVATGCKNQTACNSSHWPGHCPPLPNWRYARIAGTELIRLGFLKFYCQA